MPIVLRTRTQRLTNDQHRVEIAAHDVTVEQSLSLALDEDLKDAPTVETPPSHTLAYDVYIRWESTDVDDAGYSTAPDEVIEGHPAPGMKCIVWRGFRLGEKRHFLLKRKKSGAYTVELSAEAHIRIVASGATGTVTFPPTP